MPELPEVEYARSLLARALLGQRITEVKYYEDNIVFSGVTGEKMAGHLTGRLVEAVERRGKYLFLQLDQEPHPVFHFGMSGQFHLRGEAPMSLRTGPTHPDQVWPPKFTKIELVAQNGAQLAMTNARRLGRIRLEENPLQSPPIRKLGFDPLVTMPCLEDFSARVTQRRANVKALLLNQSFAAGVGNWLADEILYQAAISPLRKANTLSKGELKALHQALTRVVREAVAVDADKARFPKAWLFHYRWGQVEGSQTHAGEDIKYIQVAGRTTAWVPSRQR